jgi:dCTP deaminase
MVQALAKHKGTLPDSMIVKMIDGGFIKGANLANVRPSSLDLTVSNEIYEVAGVFQPRPDETVREVLAKISKKKISLDEPLKQGGMYLVRLNETLALPENVYAYCNPKSSSGRVDVHVRLLADRVSRYDAVTPAGWPRQLAGKHGELWLSIMPKTFAIKLPRDYSLNQIRFFNADTRFDELELELAMQEQQLLWRVKKKVPFNYRELRIRDGDGAAILTLDLSAKIVGYRGLVTKQVIDLNKINYYTWDKFFEPLVIKKADYLNLQRDYFYIFSTSEAVRVPPELACEMAPMDERSGEFRSHYAGFIDPGWGWGRAGEGEGRPLTLELRPFEDLIVRDRQPIAKIKFERMIRLPETVYDAGPSNYSKQSGPRLAKQFKF